MRRPVLSSALSLAFAMAVSPEDARADGRVLTLQYTPTTRAQVAMWIETADGRFLRTLLLTEAVGLRGIGNRPGALQMNSGFRWPFGRREGVLPVWAHRRAAAEGATEFRRVIFQNRTSEGHASRSSEDSTADSYFCLSFNTQAALDVDAVSCASQFNSDKGRYIRQDDVDGGYAEPYQPVGGSTAPRALSLTSLYPPRRDTLGGAAYDHADVPSFGADARAVMPEIDAVTRATAPADTTQLVQFTIPSDWPTGDYVVYLEVNTERDFNASWTAQMRPTPRDSALPDLWDYWAENYGFTYRGQPSVVYRVAFTVDAAGGSVTTETPVGYGELEGMDGTLRPMDATISDDPTGAPGSGADRLRRAPSGERLRLDLQMCSAPPPVPAVDALEAEPVDDVKHSHEWAHVGFTAIEADGRPAVAYQVKISTTPITDELSFERAEDAKATTVEFQGLDLCPVVDGDPVCPDGGSRVEVDIGKLTYQTRYHLAVRAVGPCGALGAITSTTFETTPIHFETVAPCFIATAAYGSPMAGDVVALRGFRDGSLMPSAPGRAFVSAYYAVGPTLARFVSDTPWLRAVARALLEPFAASVRTPR